MPTPVPGGQRVDRIAQDSGEIRECFGRTDVTSRGCCVSTDVGCSSPEFTRNFALITSQIGWPLGYGEVEDEMWLWLRVLVSEQRPT